MKKVFIFYIYLNFNITLNLELFPLIYLTTDVIQSNSGD